MPADRQRHWRNNLRVTWVLMAIWFVVTFVSTWFARDLDFAFFGWSFSYWVAAQGAVIVYVLIVAVYARVMRGMDRQ